MHWIWFQGATRALFRYVMERKMLLGIKRRAGQKAT
jgi:hypothetical protein